MVHNSVKFNGNIVKRSEYAAKLRGKTEEEYKAISKIHGWWIDCETVVYSL